MLAHFGKLEDCRAVSMRKRPDYKDALSVLHECKVCCWSSGRKCLWDRASETIRQAMAPCYTPDSTSKCPSLQIGPPAAISADDLRSWGIVVLYGPPKTRLGLAAGLGKVVGR